MNSDLIQLAAELCSDKFVRSHRPSLCCLLKTRSSPCALPIRLARAIIGWTRTCEWDLTLRTNAI